MTRRTQTLSALAAVTVAVAAVVVVGPGYHAAQVRMRSGMIWLAANRTGEAILLDGASAEVAARVPVGEPGDALSVTQLGAAAVVLHHKTGRLSRVDAATLEVDRSATMLPTSPGLVVKTARDAIHGVNVHSGTVTSVDPGTLAPKGAATRLAEALNPDSVAVDDGGRLWAIDNRTGNLVWLTNGERRTRSTATRTGHLAITGNQPALVDPERGTAELLSSETGAVTRSARTGLRAGDAVAVGGSAERSRLLIATGTRGELVTCAFDTGSCADPVRVSAPGAELGPPVEVDNHAVVPDYSTGQATIVDLTTSRIVAQRQLFDHPGRFELIARDGIVFFNDPNSDIAGVLNLAGKVWTITKYAGRSAEADTPPASDQRAQATQVTKADHEKRKPERGIPGQIIPPAKRTPTPDVPASGASIVVSPGNRGAAGTEFELTLVLQSPNGESDTSWRLGDGTARSGTTISHTWHEQGVFTVEAIASFDSGAHVRATTTVTVDPPEAPPLITALNVRRPKPVIGESVRFSADSTGKPDRWAWTVTRPGSAVPEVTAGTAEFDHAFSVPGTYAVTLAITRGTRTVTSSREFTVALGAVKAWGSYSLEDSPIPQSAESGVVAISAGGVHGLALKVDGSVLAWRRNNYGQTDVPPEATANVIAIAAGGYHSLALKSDGSVIGWGYNEEKQVAVPSSALHGVVAIAAGGDHSLALKDDGSVIGWGDDEYGQSSIPPEALSDVTAISAGRDHSLALKSDGSVVHWGRVHPLGPQLPPEAKSGVVAIASGNNYGLAVKSDGSVIGWGWSYEEVVTLIPEEAMSGVVTISALTHALALKSDGSMIGWGHSRPGASLIPPEFSTGALAIAAGGHFSLVLM